MDRRHQERTIAYLKEENRAIRGRLGPRVRLTDPERRVAVLYHSGDAKTTIVAMAGKKLQFEMPANGWATVKAN